MISISIAGIGGQGNVLSAKILAQAALAKGWQVRSAETTGMAQRGGDVTSHVRMGSDGEAVYAPIPVKGTVDVIIAMEPGEGARALPLLKKGGLMVMATTGMPPATGGVKANAYDPQAIIAELRRQGVQVSYAMDENQARSGNPDYLVTGTVEQAWLREVSATELAPSMRATYRLAPRSGRVVKETLNSSQNRSGIPTGGAAEESMLNSMRELVQPMARKIKAIVDGK